MSCEDVILHFFISVLSLSRFPLLSKTSWGSILLHNFYWLTSV